MKKLHEAADSVQKWMRRTLVLAGASLIQSVVLAKNNGADPVLGGVARLPAGTHRMIIVALLKGKE